MKEISLLMPGKGLRGADGVPYLWVRLSTLVFDVDRYPSGTGIWLTCVWLWLLGVMRLGASIHSLSGRGWLAERF